MGKLLHVCLMLNSNADIAAANDHDICLMGQDAPTLIPDGSFIVHGCVSGTSVNNYIYGNQRLYFANVFTGSNYYFDFVFYLPLKD